MITPSITDKLLILGTLPVPACKPDCSCGHEFYHTLLGLVQLLSQLTSGCVQTLLTTLSLGHPSLTVCCIVTAGTCRCQSCGEPRQHMRQSMAPVVCWPSCMSTSGHRQQQLLQQGQHLVAQHRPQQLPMLRLLNLKRQVQRQLRLMARLARVGQDQGLLVTQQQLRVKLGPLPH